MITITGGTDTIIKIEMADELKGEIVEVMIGPEDYIKLVSSIGFCQEEDISSGASGQQVASQLYILQRIKSWSGISLPDGEEAACSMHNKLAFFGQYPLAYIQLVTKLKEAQTEELKNLKPSQAG